MKKLPFMDRARYLRMVAFLNHVEVRSLAEIGVWNGRNAYFMRLLFPEAHLYLIDPWKPTSKYLEEGQPPAEETEDYEYAHGLVQFIFEKDPHTTILRKKSLDALDSVPGNLDLVFIDANHDYASVKEDIERWSQKVRAGGIVAGHDYSPEFPGVMQAVNECLPNQFEVGDDTVWSTIKS